MSSETLATPAEARDLAALADTALRSLGVLRSAAEHGTDLDQAAINYRDATTALFDAIGEAKGHIDALKAEVDRHRERANAAQVAWLGHSDHDCAVKCCREIEAALGTESPVEAAKVIREVQAENARLKAICASLTWPDGGRVPHCPIDPERLD